MKEGNLKNSYEQALKKVTVRGSVSVSPCTCPNTKCTHDKELQPGLHCPLCGEQAREFKFGELDNLWKQKWAFKKSIKRAKKQETISRRRKFCPRCGSSNINVLVFFRPSTWKCLDCGYEDAFVIEDSKLAEKLRERSRKR